MPPEFWDISVPITTAMPTWPNSQGLKLTPVLELSRGDGVNETHIAMGTHVGTHIDAPLHFLADGASVEQAPLSSMVGPVQVIEVRSGQPIAPCDIEGAIRASTRRVLFKTGNSSKWGWTRQFEPDYISLTPEAAAWLAKRGTVLVGVDYLSVEEFGGNGDVHRALLRGGVVVVEGLDLSAVEPGDYWLICLPLRLVGAEGAPARAVLMRPGLEGAAA